MGQINKTQGEKRLMFKEVLLTVIQSNVFQNSVFAAFVLAPCVGLVAFIYQLIKLSKEHRKEKDK